MAFFQLLRQIRSSRGFSALLSPAPRERVLKSSLCNANLSRASLVISFQLAILQKIGKFNADDPQRRGRPLIDPACTTAQYSIRLPSFSEYLCHGTWIENDTAYLVASTDVGRYCLVYSASAATTGNRELSVTGHLASCPRASHRHPVSWQVNLTSYGKRC